MEAEKKSRVHPGDVFGRWTVLEGFILTDKGSKKWMCRCQCGTERYVLERSLLYGGSVSCGCQRRVGSQDLTGQQFGDLTVLRRLENAQAGASRWLCRCACGEEYIAQGSQLLTGRRTHCTGRAHEKNYAYADITGRRFGRLTALYPSRRYDKSGSVIWRCRCDCGGETDASYNALAYGNQKSCGCQKREQEQKLGSFLTHVAGTSVDMLKSKKLPADNTTGYKGVYRIRGKYVAKIVFQKKQYILGAYDEIEEAARARREAEVLLFDSVTEHYQKWKEFADRDPQWAEENPVQVTVNREGDKLTVSLLPELGEPETAVS